MSKPHMKKYLCGLQQGLCESVDSQFHVSMDAELKVKHDNPLTLVCLQDTMIRLLDSPKVLTAIGRRKVGSMWVTEESANWIVSRVSSCITDQVAVEHTSHCSC